MEEATEHVSCGSCKTVNNIPFGLERFKCYKCMATVAVARESMAACAAASPTALYFEGLQQHHQAGPGSTAPRRAAVQEPRVQSAPTASSSSGFFEKFAKSMDKTMQKVEKAFFEPVEPPSTKVPPPAIREVRSAPARQVQQPLSEEEQLQWALQQSLRESQAQGRPESSPAPRASAAAAAAAELPDPGDALKAAAAQAAARLHAAEERTMRAEQELAEATAREAQAAADRRALKRQLAEQESLVRSLTDQLESLQQQSSERARRIEALEKALQDAREDSRLDVEEGEEEHQGTVAQLLSRISDLEATLMQATHFAAPVSPVEAKAVEERKQPAAGPQKTTEGPPQQEAPKPAAAESLGPELEAAGPSPKAAASTVEVLE